MKDEDEVIILDIVAKDVAFRSAKKKQASGLKKLSEVLEEPKRLKKIKRWKLDDMSSKSDSQRIGAIAMKTIIINLINSH